MDEDARWCQGCPLVREVEPEAQEETCRDCIASDLNKDIIFEDLFFARMWRGLQLKQAGIPVMEIIQDLDEALILQAMETKIKEVHRQQQEDKRDNKPPTDDE